MDVILLIGRVMLGMIFIGSGVAGHLMQTEGTAAYAEMRGLKNPKGLTQVSGVLIAAGGVGLVLGIWMDVAALGLAVYSLAAAFLIHHFWSDEDPALQQSEMTQFMKNLSIAGGCLILFAFYNELGEAVGLTITGPLL